MVTPAREGEAALATWADFDITGKAWTQPTSKNKRPHRFPLNDKALAILERRREKAGKGVTPGALVFPGPASGKVFGGWSNLKVSLDARLTKAHAEQRLAEAVKPWRLHDFRRTAATALGELGYDDALVDMLLNHTAAGTRASSHGPTMSRSAGKTACEPWRHGAVGSAPRWAKPRRRPRARK